MIQQLREIVLHNLGIKIASVVLATFVYLHVFSSENREFILNVPIALVGLPEGLTYLTEVPKSVPVRMEAEGFEHWRIRTRPPTALINLSEARAGLLQRPVTIEDVRMPGNSSANLKGIETPTVLALDIENLIEKVLPVRPVVRGQPGDQAVLYGETKILPDSAQVRGPESLVSPLTTIPTEEIDLDGRNKSVEEPFDLVSIEGVELDRASVRVSIPIVPIERRVVGPLSVRIPASLGPAWTTSPESVNVVLEGPTPLLETVELTDVEVRAVPIPPVGEEQESVELLLTLNQRLEPHMQSVSPEPETVLLVRRAR